MKRNPLKEALLGLVTLVVTIVILYGAAEVAVRLFVDNGMNFNLEMWKYARDMKQRSADPLIGHEHRAIAQAHLMGVDVATNAIGHRDHEYPVERQPGVPRIIMLGDSFIEGWGVPFEDTITKRLERCSGPAEGRGHEHRGRQLRTIQEVEGFLTRDAKFKPDIVVLNFDFRSATRFRNTNTQLAGPPFRGDGVPDGRDGQLLRPGRGEAEWDSPISISSSSRDGRTPRPPSIASPIIAGNTASSW